MMAGIRDYASVARAPFLVLPPTLIASGAAAERTGEAEVPSEIV